MLNKSIAAGGLQDRYDLLERRVAFRFTSKHWPQILMNDVPKGYWSSIPLGKGVRMRCETFLLHSVDGFRGNNHDLFVAIFGFIILRCHFSTLLF